MATLEQRKHFVKLMRIVKDAVSGPKGQEFVNLLGMKQTDIFPCGVFNWGAFLSLAECMGAFKNTHVAPIYNALCQLETNDFFLDEFRDYIREYTKEQIVSERDLLYTELVEFTKLIFAGPHRENFVTMTGVDRYTQLSELFNVLHQKEIFHYNCTYPLYEILYDMNSSNFSSIFHPSFNPKKVLKYLEYHQQYLSGDLATAKNDFSSEPAPIPVTAMSISQIAASKGEEKKVQECVICMTVAPNIFIGCSHICCCENCVLKIKECPLCKEPIEKRIKIVLPL